MRPQGLGRAWVRAWLTRELHGLAYAHRERLGASIAGFAEAVNWPFPEDVPQGVDTGYGLRVTRDS